MKLLEVGGWWLADQLDRLYCWAAGHVPLDPRQEYTTCSRCTRRLRRFDGRWWLE